MGWRVGVGTFHTSDSQRANIEEVLNSDRLSYGHYSRTFEDRFSELHRCKYGVLSNSGTSSLHVALQALKIRNNWADWSEVIMPAINFVAGVNVTLHNNLAPVLVDVDWQTYNLNPNLIEDALTERTVAIMPVHMFGQPCDMQAIVDIAKRHDLFVIEDACEAAFAKHHDGPVGSWGHVGCFSFYVAHLLTTGVGGIATTNDKGLALMMRSLVNHGRDPIYYDIDTEPSEEVRRRRFVFRYVGHSFRVTELEAALALPQLADYPTMLLKRRQNAMHLRERLRHLEEAGVLQLPYVRSNNTHSFMMFPIIWHQDKWGFCAHLESKGIETREMMPITNQPVYEQLFREDDYPNAKYVNNHGLYIGCHQDLTRDDLRYIVDTICDYAEPFLTDS